MQLRKWGLRVIIKTGKNKWEFRAYLIGKKHRLFLLKILGKIRNVTNNKSTKESAN